MLFFLIRKANENAYTAVSAASEPRQRAISFPIVRIESTLCHAAHVHCAQQQKHRSYWLVGWFAGSLLFSLIFVSRALALELQLNVLSKMHIIFALFSPHPSLLIQMFGVSLVLLTAAATVRTIINTLISLPFH